RGALRVVQPLQPAGLGRLGRVLGAEHAFATLANGSPGSGFRSASVKEALDARRTERGGGEGTRSAGGGDEVDQHLRELGAPVLLEEVTAALDRGVRLALRAGHPLEEDPLAARGDRVAVAEGAQERPLEP